MATSRASAPTLSLFRVIVAGAATAFALSVPILPAAANEEIEFELSIKDHKFDPPQLKIPAQKGVKLSVKNLDASPEEFESHDLGIEKVIPGNSSATIRIKPMPAGTYIFFGEYHEATAQGHILVE